MRAASFLACLLDPPARDGSGVVVDVYPADALLRWGHPSIGYKGKEKSEVGRELVERLVREVTPWLAWRADDIDLCPGSDDAFDAVVAALVARAACVRLVEPIPGEDHIAAMSEGWIAVPLEGSLTELPRL